MTYFRASVAFLALCAVLWPLDPAHAHGVTTGAVDAATLRDAGATAVVASLAELGI